MLMRIGDTPYHEKKRAKLKKFRERLACPLGYISHNLEHHLALRERSRIEQQSRLSKLEDDDAHDNDQEDQHVNNKSEIRSSPPKNPLLDKLEPYVCMARSAAICGGLGN